MTSYHSLRIGVVATLLLVLMVVAGHGQPVHPAVPKAVHVAGFGEQLWNRLVHLLPRAWQKEGTSIDPNGTRNGSIPNPPVVPNEGTSIDPDGL